MADLSFSRKTVPVKNVKNLFILSRDAIRPILNYF